MDHCYLCDELNADIPKAWNEPLFESTNFVVIPSLGALIQGWLLLVPRKHHICMGSLAEDSLHEMLQMKAAIASVMQQEYGSVCAFEHGPSKQQSQVGISA